MSDSSKNPFSEALIAGCSPIPVDTATKRPLLRWEPFQHERMNDTTARAWDTRDVGLGIVCGQISGRLVAFDFEGEFMKRASDLHSVLASSGLDTLFATWVDGYCERTPSGGRHVLVRVEGEGPLEGNQKLASSAEGRTLIETRGEGGYVIVAPSRNHKAGWELISGNLSSIPWASIPEFKAVVAALARLDQSPPPPSPTGKGPQSPSILRLSEDWFDDEKATLPDIEIVLQQHGWTQARSSDGYGTHWVRPDKDPREGHSASLNHESHRLWVHSSNASPLPVGVSLDNLDVILCYELGRAPSTAERTSFIVDRRKARQPATPADGRQAAGEPAPPSLCLPDEFWKSRKYLSHIHQAALASWVNPDALWEAVKVFFAASVSPQIVIPYRGTLDYIGVVVGKAGAGKTMAKRTALELLPPEFHEQPRVRLGAPPGSGEGMVEFFIDRSEGTQRQRFDGAGFYVDEGKWLLDVNSRLGNTSVQAIKQAWSGELTGSLAATQERNRWLAPGACRVAVLISIQPGVAADFLRTDLTEGGFPQRLSWGWAHPESVPDEPPEHPGFLDIPLWNLDHWGTSYDPRAKRVMTYCDELIAIVAAARRDGVLGADTHGGHDILAQLKGAALLALMDDRTSVSMLDWELAQLDWNTGIEIRNHLLRTQIQGAQDKDAAAGRSAAARKIAEEGVYLEKAIVSLVLRLRQADTGLTMRDIKDHLRQYNRRHGIHHQEVLTLAIERGLVRRAEGGRFTD